MNQENVGMFLGKGCISGHNIDLGIEMGYEDFKKK
jgi:hypothetical protein